MRSFLLVLGMLCAFSFLSVANNVQIGNMYLRAQDNSAGTRNIRLDLSWDNSWRTSTYESNWDAVWVFAKWRKLSNPNGPWYHATMKNSGTSAFTTGTTTDGTASSPSSVSIPTDKKGAFVYRSGDGIGSMNLKGLELVWDYKADGLNDIDSVAICVYGIEMVYIPQGAFYVGDGSTGAGSSVGQLIKGTTTNTPFQITSEASINIDNTSTNSLWGTSTSGNSTIGATGTLPAAFPKGFQAMYVMKYSITQGQYRDFLNKLVQTQQAQRGFGITVPGAYYSNNSSPSYRNALRLLTLPSLGTIPRTYDVDLNNNGTGNESNDGENIPCSIMSFPDMIAYLDWCALRPLTELEFEKICRGNQPYVPAEKAWGTTNIYPATMISNAGTASEIPNSNTNVAYGNNNNVLGPVRVGSFAAVNTVSASGPTREMAGATYYGVMEMTGNLYTYIYDVANGRAFDGTNGDGAIDPTTGNATGTWPTAGGVKGGAWSTTNSNEINVSDRTNAAGNYNGRYWYVGGRGGRTN